MFKENGIMARKVSKLAEIKIIDIDKNIPSLICNECVRQLEKVDEFVARILDADAYYTMITCEKELKTFRENVKKVKAEQLSDANKKKTVPELKRIENVHSDEEFFIPEVFKRGLEIKEAEEMILKKPKIEKEEDSPVVKAEKDEKKEPFMTFIPSDVTNITTRSSQKSKSKPKKRTASKKSSKVKTCYECDTCKGTFINKSNLDEHLKVHECK